MSRVEFDLIARDNASEQFRRAAESADRAEATAKAMRGFLATGTEASERLASAMRSVVRGLQSFAEQLSKLFRRPIPNPPIPLHGFTPNFDLVCRVCGVGPEECRGGRA